MGRFAGICLALTALVFAGSQQALAAQSPDVAEGPQYSCIRAFGKPTAAVLYAGTTAAPITSTLASRLANMEYLRLLEVNAPFADAEAKAILLNALPGMQSLETLRWAPWLDMADIERLRAVPNLRKLDLSRGNLPDEGLRAIAQLPKLESLDLTAVGFHGPGPAKPFEEHLRHLQGAQRLRELVLRCNPVGTAELKAIAEIKSLARLRIISFPGYRNLPCFTDEGLEALSRLPHLAELHLHGSRMCAQYTPEGLMRLAANKRLAVLGLTGINHGNVGGLAALERLEELDLSDTDITDADVTRLQTLRCLRHLNLSGTDVGDAGLKQLGTLPNMHSLRLEGCTLTDAAVPVLSDYPRLRFLDVRETQISEEGLKRLRESLPDTLIWR